MRKIYSLACLALLLTTGCASGQPADSIAVNMTDFAFHPNRFTVPAGEEIHLEIVNGGAAVHNFIILKSGAGGRADIEDESKVHWQIELRAGERATASFTAPSGPGEYLIACNTAGHYEAGMTGKLIVVDDR